MSFHDDISQMVARMLKCRKAITDKHGTAKPRLDLIGNLPCPACCSGTLRYRISSYNGHVAAECTTAGCAQWMELRHERNRFKTRWRSMPDYY